MFHEKLKESRTKSGKTQKDLAEYLSISPQSVSKWEKGEALPSMEYLPKIAKFFGCTPNDFFGIEENQEKKEGACKTDNSAMRALKAVQENMNYIAKKKLELEKEYIVLVQAEKENGGKQELHQRKREIEEMLKRVCLEQEHVARKMNIIAQEVYAQRD